MTEATPFKGEDSLDAWLDRHHVDRVRTTATNLEGALIGKYCNRSKFIKTLPGGHGIGDIALAMDLAGTPHLMFWHEFRNATIGDVALRPDLDTLISDGTDPNLGHCICDFTALDGTPIPLCPRTMLKQQLASLNKLGFSAKATFELEFFLFDNSYAEARRRQYRNLTPVGATTAQTIYLVRNAVHAKRFMDRVTARLEWYGIDWEGWNDENGAGQIELNLTPGDPLSLCDATVRAKQIIYEVGLELDMAPTFMAHPMRGFSSGMHIHHSLHDAQGSAFFDENAPQQRSQTLMHWLGGLIETMPGAVSYLCPTMNAYRRMAEFAAPPVVASWGEENKSAALRLVSSSPGTARVEHRLGSADVNPYLAMAVILAGGQAGLAHQLVPGDELTELGWGLPARFERLPNSMMTAAKALREDRYLNEQLGSEEVLYWTKTRRLEWLSFHTEGGDPESRETTQWELNRYFELI